MNAILSTTLTMSSREIAKLCEKRHDHVMRDIGNMLSELNIDAPQFRGTYKTSQGNEYECFNLPKRETLILVSGYRLELRAKIIDRWQELEQQTSRLTTPDERAGLRQAVTMLTTKRGLMHDEAYRLVHQRFNVGSIDELTHEQLPQAVEYVQRMALSGELLPHEGRQDGQAEDIRNHQIAAVALMECGLYRYREQKEALRRLADDALRAMEALEAAKAALGKVLARGDRIFYGSGAIYDGLHEASAHLNLPAGVVAEGRSRAARHYRPKILAD